MAELQGVGAAFRRDFYFCMRILYEKESKGVVTLGMHIFCVMERGKYQNFCGQSRTMSGL